MNWKAICGTLATFCALAWSAALLAGPLPGVFAPALVTWGLFAATAVLAALHDGLSS